MLYKKRFGYRLILSIISFVLILSFSACAQSNKNIEEKTNSVPVIVMSVKRGNLQSSTLYTGIVKPKKIAYVVSAIPGQVSKVNFEIGDRVKSGETLFSVDSKEIEASISLLLEQLRVAKANCSLAETQVVSAMGSGYESQKIQLEAVLMSAEHNYTAIKRLYDAATILYELNSITSLKYYEIKNNFEQAKNALKAADNAYNLYIDELSVDVINSSKQQLKQAQASYDAIKIQIESARQKLKYCDVISPMDGVIATKDILEGSLISNTMVPYVVADIDTVQVMVSVTEKVINKISEGQEIKILIPAASSGQFIGQVAKLSPVIDQNTFSYQVLINVPNPKNLIKPGMTAKAEMLDEKHDNVILAPINSILNDDAGTYVFIVENKKGIKRYVDTGISNNEFIEITKGLQVDQQLVIRGQHFLNHNDAVAVTQEGF